MFVIQVPPHCFVIQELEPLARFGEAWDACWSYRSQIDGIGRIEEPPPRWRRDTSLCYPTL
jgi:hypothetical protein